MAFPWFDPHHPMFHCHNNILCQKNIEMRKLNHRLQYIVALKRISEMMWFTSAVEDDVRVQKSNGVIQAYNVTTIMVLDTRNEQLYLSNSIKNNDNNRGLILITCYPFDSVSASMPYRLVVQAS